MRKKLKQAPKQMILNAIRQYKESGIKEIDVIDLHWKTKLSIEKIGSLMNKLEREGVVSGA